MTIAFITGITGQDGSYLAEFLLAKNYQVVGLVSAKHDIGGQNIAAIKNKIKLVSGDLLDRNSLAAAIKQYQPDEIYNLGGMTFVPKSWDEPSLTFDINTLGVTRILEAIRDHAPKSRFYQATSAKIFGRPAESPQTETTPLNPVDPYSVSKAAAHYLVQAFRNHFGIFAVSGILYNHESERRGPEFVTRKITQTAVKIKLGLEKQLTLGNLDDRQDWGYAPDYIEAMWLMLQQEKAADYIIASGQSHSVREVCVIAFSYLGLSYRDYVITDKNLIRKTEARELLGNAGKAERILGWRPKTSFKDMIIKMTENDLKLLRRKS
ncbi:GDP-mannose 4,6-dehydratase [Candidatus Beckwithbacteria bacterium RIFCSPLOWO2_02_FULL_47_23]|uniref:GDP-mannose 4,6-dehydratase n=2 Tax=Candidatus Beckwithiibacteriota TaxID=1752726 RepID=A0A1F5E1I4_9BACT|nr:MAG: GDP-mannose 4,6-dehydratase [Candidatus Beckwithbacteria bacterium RIFCSPHIGHO2_12_FULL_47_17]OGD61265.1 MAG: GDP-mannose 4,6-dehydratase [Candidatus Beckwithbacteria bacterium RIFCSPLOWO2_02_FULL_47_23]